MFNNDERIGFTETELFFIMDFITDVLNEMPEDDPYPQYEIDILLQIKDKIRRLVRS